MKHAFGCVLLRGVAQVVGSGAGIGLHELLPTFVLPSVVILFCLSHSILETLFLLRLA